MKQIILIAAGALIGASGLWAQPRLRAENPVVNGASYATGIAQGSVFVVFGTNLSGANITLPDRLPLVTSMNGTSIRFAPVSGGAAVDAYMAYTTQNQIAGILPSVAPVGDYNVTVTYNNQTSASARVPVVARNLGLVSAASSGSGQAVATVNTPLNLNRFARGSLGGYTLSPAAPGDVIVLWGTGLGADTLSDPAGGTSGDRTATANVRVVIGDKEITPVYAGRSSGLPGTDQINVPLPADIATGCLVPLQVRVGSTLSNLVTLSIARPGETACIHPFLAAEALRRVAEGGSLVLGSISLSKIGASLTVPILGSIDTNTESISASFARYGLGNLGEYVGAAFLPPGTCTVYRRVGTQQTLLTGVPPATPLDAGAQLTLNGPNATNIAIPRDQDKYYSKTLAQSGFNIPGLPGGTGGTNATPVIAPGTYTVAGTGGPDIGAFSASLTIPADITWTNKSAITEVNRGQGVTVNWSGGGQNLVEIIGLSGALQTGSQDKYDVAVFACFANASAGTFTVPGSILTQMPANTADLLTGQLGTLGVQLVNVQSRFNAPLTGGGNVDFATFDFSSGSNKTVPYR